VKDDLLYLRHILEAIDRIRTYTSAGHDLFRGDARGAAGGPLAGNASPMI
jgi:hypothetical protein